MSIMTLLEKQIKDRFNYTLHPYSHREENPKLGWEMEKHILPRGRGVDHFDPEHAYALDEGRSNELGSRTTSSKGLTIKYNYRELN